LLGKGYGTEALAEMAATLGVSTGTVKAAHDGGDVEAI
jgi:hypothetical protein